MTEFIWFGLLPSQTLIELSYSQNWSQRWNDQQVGPEPRYTDNLAEEILGDLRVKLELVEQILVFCQ